LTPHDLIKCEVGPIESIYLSCGSAKLLRKEDLMALIRPALAVTPYLPKDAASAMPSAVLVIIHYHNDTPHIFLTRRSSMLKSHRGEISFPGGKYAGSDSTFLATALRETKEEIGIAFLPEQVVGSLRAVRTITSNHFIVPFVTLQDRLPEHRISASEVESVIDAPLIETLASMEPDTEHYALAKEVFKFTYDGNVIWGATARIMKQLHDLLIGK
jgi:8-oxo-dGTP pyrophosphatase MutT (NUDIX family)